MSYYQKKLSQIKRNCYSNEHQIESVIALREYIDTHFEHDLNLDRLSEVRFTSKFHLQRLFKRYYGLTPRQYLIDVRIRQSKEHLSSEMSVTETCFAVGFESLGSFSTLFKTKTGQSPSEFQKAQVSRSRTDEGS